MAEPSHGWALPEWRECGAGVAKNRVLGREKNSGHPLVGGGPFFPRASTEIGRLAGGICSDNEEIRRGADPRVSDPGGNEHRVALLDVYHGARWSAKLDFGPARRHTQDFVGGRVVVVEGIHPIAPASSPTVSTKERLERDGPAWGQGRNVVYCR